MPQSKIYEDFFEKSCGDMSVKYDASKYLTVNGFCNSSE